MTKFYALQKNVFDISKITVVGSPTITDEGVASGFTTADYLNIPVLDLSSGNFTIETTFKFTPQSKRQVMWRCATDAYLGTFGFLIGVDPNNKLYTSGVSDIIYNTALTEGLYTLKLSVQNGTVKTYLDGNLIINGTYNKTINTAYISIGLARGVDPWLDTIDLNSFKIYVDNELVYSPTKPTYFLERRKEGFDLSKFTIVGSPTITEDGVVSGLSSSDCIRTPIIIEPTSQLEILINFNTPASISANNMILDGRNDNIISGSLFYFGLNKDGFYQLAFGVSSTSDISGWLNLGNIDYSKNVSFKLTWNGTTYNIYKSVDNSNYTLIKTISSSTALKTMNYSVGSFSFGGSVFTGSIDLPSFSITVDGEEVFTGAKEKYYAMKSGK